MANKYTILRQEKRRGPGMINGIWAENIRSILGKNVDENRSHLNITLTPLAFKNYDHFIETRSEQIDMANKKRDKNETQARKRYMSTDKKTGKRIHISLMQEFVFTHTPGALSEDESIRYCKLAYEFIKNWFDVCNIILAIIHLDETTPHIHIWIDYYDKFENRFKQSILQKENKTDINAIRDAWQERLTEEGYDLLRQDGSVVGDDHDGSKADKEKGELKKQILELTEKGESLESSNLVLIHENETLQKEKDTLKKEKNAQIDEYKSKNSKLSNTLKRLKHILPPWQKYLKNMYGLDISKEMPPIESLKPRIESTLQNEKVSKATDSTIPSLL